MRKRNGWTLIECNVDLIPICVFFSLFKPSVSSSSFFLLFFDSFFFKHFSTGNNIFYSSLPLPPSCISFFSLQIEIFEFFLLFFFFFFYFFFFNFEFLYFHYYVFLIEVLTIFIFFIFFTFYFAKKKFIHCLNSFIPFSKTFHLV